MATPLLLKIVGAILLLALIPIILFFILTRRLAPYRRIQLSDSPSEMSIAEKIQHAKNFTELCAVFGYMHEEHVVTTKDGYLLTLHRLPWKKGENANNATGERRPAVYLHHGLLTSSELFMCLTDLERSLPFVLVENGYDVWLGNNRGNRYSHKHVEFKPSSPRFWDFSIDDFARYDIPDSINFILEFTKFKTMTYIGFSQGTAQAFAALSMHPDLNEKINVFVALAPIMRPAGFASPMLDSIVKHSPSILYHVFGRKSMFGSVAMFQSTLPTSILRKIIDISLVFLFDYHSHNITQNQKVAGYAHIYCYSSVKAVVHWLQIMRNSTFHMYDDDIVTRVARTGASDLQQFPTQGIKTPMVLLYGDRDSLVDMDATLAQLPDNITAVKLPNYEHLDVLWGKDVHRDVIPVVLEALKRYNT